MSFFGRVQCAGRLSLLSISLPGAFFIQPHCPFPLLAASSDLFTCSLHRRPSPTDRRSSAELQVHGGEQGESKGRARGDGQGGTSLPRND